MKAHFAWKQLKVVDYSKNIWKKENRGHGFVCFSVGYMLVKKNYGTLQSVGAGAHKVRKVVSLWPNFDPNFPDIWKVRKG